MTVKLGFIGTGGIANHHMKNIAENKGFKVVAACDLMAEGQAPAAASRRALGIMKRRVDGLGGLIGIDRKGRVGFAYNTPRMARSIITKGGRKAVDI